MQQKYHILLRILHWSMAVLLIFLLTLGFYMAGLDDQNSYKKSLFSLHKSLGVLALLLLLTRLTVRLSTKIPPLPETIPPFIRGATHLVHYILYLLMILMPLSGYLMSNAFGYQVYFFKWGLPNLMPVNPELGKFFVKSHEILAFTIITLVSLHLIGVIKHRFFDVKENNILPRIL